MDMQRTTTMPTPSPQPPTRFLILSDTHNLEPDSTDSPLDHPLPPIDVLFHCGDLTHCGGFSSYKKALRLLSIIDAELKLVIAGNHDLELDKEYWATHLDADEGDEEADHGRAMEIMTGRLAEEAGVTFLRGEGTYEFFLRGGRRLRVYASPYTPAFGDWAFAYDHSQDRFNDPSQVAEGIATIAENPIPDGVDIVMTHGPPKGVLDSCAQGNVGCENLLRAVGRVRPLAHCFGHVHEGYGVGVMDWEEGKLGKVDVQKGEEGGVGVVKAEVVRGRETLMVNAAIMDGENRPVNRPWVVEISLGSE